MRLILHRNNMYLYKKWKILGFILISITIPYYKKFFFSIVIDLEINENLYNILLIIRAIKIIFIIILVTYFFSKN